MKLKHIASNMTELHLNNGIVVLFSYGTPVAAHDCKPTNGYAPILGVIKTNKKYSVTTTRHINKWFDFRNQQCINNTYSNSAGYDSPVNYLSAFTPKEVDQSVLDDLVRGV